MASNIPDQTKKMEEVLRCAICLGIYNNPKSLPCFHTFCEDCINQITIVQENDYAGIRCPKCRSFSKKGDYINLYIIDEFIDVYKMGTIKEKLCQLCNLKEVKAEFRCINCKINICGVCQKRHSKSPMAKGHKFTNCDDYPDFMVEHQVFCTEHSDQAIDLYCAKCKKSVCQHCAGLTHEGHDIVTIDSILKKIIPEIEKTIESFECTQDELENETLALEIEIDRTKKTYEDIKQSYDLALHDLIAKATQQHAKALQDLNKRRDRNIKTIKMSIDTTKDEIRNKKEITNLAKASLENAKGSSLMKALEAGLLAKLKDEESKTLHHQEVRVQVPVYYDNEDIFHDQMLGSTYYQEETLLYNCPWKIRHGVCDFVEVAENCSDRQDIVEIGTGNTYNISFVNDQIWFPFNDDTTNTNAISVYSLDGIKIKDINMVHRPRAIQQVNHKEVIVACKNGLYVLNTKGEMRYTITNGNFTHVSVDGNQVAAVELSKRQVVIVTRVDNNWQLHHYFELDAQDEKLKTLHFIGGAIYVCMNWQHKIYKYNINGELLEEYGTGNKGKELGQLYAPYVCGSDKYGSLIISDAGNSRFQMLNPQGSWEIVKLEGIEWPSDVIVVGSTLFVLWGKGKPIVLSKFVNQ